MYITENRSDARDLDRHGRKYLWHIWDLTLTNIIKDIKTIYLLMHLEIRVSNVNFNFL